MIKNSLWIIIGLFLGIIISNSLGLSLMHNPVLTPVFSFLFAVVWVTILYKGGVIK